MHDEHTKKLRSDFPDLYHELDGFAIGDGWYDLMYRLSERITAMVAGIPEANPRDYCVIQVKEKFGGLRFYMNNCTEGMADAIEEAEGESFRTCEACGKEGKLRLGSWDETLCDRCYRRDEDEEKGENVE